MARINPILSDPNQVSADPFSSVDPSAISWPDKPSPTENAYHQTVGLEPDQAAAVVGLSQKTGQPPEFVGNNLDAVKKAAAIPPSDFFADVDKKYPQTSQYLSDPKNMAVAKDDIPNIAKTEGLVKDYGLGQTLFNSAVTGFAKVNEQLAGIPNVLKSYANLIPNLALKAVGKPQLSSDFPGSSEAMQYWSDMAKFYNPPINDQSITDVLKTRNVSQISKTLASKLVEQAPSLALLIASSAAGGSEAGIATAGITSASDVLERNKQIGMDPADAAINSAYHGSINAAFMNLGALSPLHKWETAIAGSIGKDSARQVVLDMAKTITGSFASMGSAMAAMTFGTSAVDALTGANPNAMQGVGKRALDAGIEGGITGAAMVGPAAILGGMARSADVQRAEKAKNFYLALGDTMADSKLRARLPEAHQQLINNLTKDGPVSNVYIPAADYDTYWQSKKIDPDQMARQLGVSDQIQTARESGGDIAIPLSTWADKVVGTPHYDGLADDIKFRPEDLTTRQVTTQQETVGKLVQGEADKAVQENPKLQEGRDFVYSDLKKQLTATGQLDPAKVDAQAQLGASMITQMAAQRGQDPEAFYRGEPIKVTDAQGKAPEEALQQPTEPGADPRGFIQFTPKETLIGMVKADASTFPHELAHYWLKNFHDFVQSGAAQENHLSDWGTLKGWLKVGDDQKELTRDQHEQFARGFESYLREGKAPSEGLKGVFAKFRKWLTRLYKDPITLGVELNDNVRGVMDRMLASENETAFAERNMGLDLGKEYEGLDPKVASRLVALREQAHEEAVTQLMTEQMKELDEAHKKMLVDESVKARVAAEDTVRKSEIQEAMQVVGKTTGADPLKTAQDYWLGKMNDERKAQFDQIAEARGYSGGDEMAKKIIAEPPVDKQIQDLVDQHMAQFADLRTRREQIQDEALKAVHNEKSIELMAREQSVFRSLVDEASGRVIDQKRRAAEAKIDAEAAKEKAKAIIAAKPVGAAGQYLPYFTAERNEALKVQKALQSKDYAEAAEAKRRQMLNHALAREAFAAREQIDKTLRFFDRFSARGQDLKNIPYGFIRQIDTLLSDRGLAAPRTEDAKTYLAIAQEMAKNGEDSDAIAHATGLMPDGRNGFKPESLQDTVQRIQNDYRNINIPNSVLIARPMAYRSMPMSDFMDLKQAVKAINAVGRGYDNFLDENIKMDRKEAAAKFRADVESNIGQKYREERLPGAKHGETGVTRTINALNNARGILTPSLVNLYSFCDYLDHGDPDGLAKNLIYRPLEHALNAKIEKSAAEVQAMKKIISDHFTEKEYKAQKKEKVYIQSMDRDFTRDQIQAFANNWGTLTGRDRVTNLIDGSKMNEVQVKEMLSNVTKKQWDYAQALWDHNDSFWPEITAQQQKVAGETPKKVTPASVETPYGTYRGGYYSLKYDQSKSNEAIKPIDERNALYKTQGAVSAHTDHGFTESRVQNYGQPVKLDTRVEFSHLEDVIHDLTHRQPIIDVSSFLRQRDTREAIINAIGREGYDTMQQHVKWVGSDQGQSLNGFTDNLLQRLRFGATTAGLGIRPATAPIFFTANVINAVKDLGPVGFAHSIMDFMSDRKANVDFVNQLIPAMAERSTLMDRDLHDMDQSLQGNDRLLSHLLFFPHQKADQAITYPMALHVYKNSVGEFGEQKAKDLAYEAVTKMAGDGSTLGQAMIQRGSESGKLFSWWYSWAGTQFNRLWRDGKMAGLAYDKGNIGAALTALGTSLFYGVGLQGANEAFWKDMVFHNSQNQDDDKRNSRMAVRIASQGLEYLPVIGPIAQYGISKMMGGQKGLDLPAVGAIETLTDPMWEWAREKYTGKDSPHFWEDTAKSAAILAKYPQYFNTLAFNFLDDMNGRGDASWRDLFTRKTKS